MKLYGSMMTIISLFALGCGDADKDGLTVTVAPPDTASPVGSAAPVDSAEPPPGDSGSGDSGSVEPDCSECAESAATMLHSVAADALESAPERTAHNALKGFMTSYLWGTPVTDFPDQIEFLYLPLKDLWSESGDTLEAGLEPLMVAAAERNHHVVLRVFVDYPNRPSGLPDHLVGDVPCSVYTEHGGGCSPDYDDPEMLEAMLGVIEAIGSRYDGDPRLGFVQLGLLGFWGEWHTWPHGDWFASADTQQAVMDAYVAAFPTTQLQIRYPVSGSVELPLGFHDDSFAHSTLGEVEWFFLPRLIAAGAEERWHEVVIGGELRPELQSGVFSDDYALGEYAQDMTECIEQTHASYLLNYHAYNGEGVGYAGVDRVRAEEAAVAMGYRFEVVEASLELSGLMDGSVEASVQLGIAQTGVAPFYYPAFAQASWAALDEPAVSDVDLSPLLPGDALSVRIDLGRVDAATVGEPMTLRLTSPMLQDGQRMEFATATPWSATEDSTVLQWTVECALGDALHPLGATLPFPAHECDCTCDVDGAFRDCDGSVCE